MSAKKLNNIVGVDLMGSDASPEQLQIACKRASQVFPKTKIVIYSNSDPKEAISNDDDPLHAVRLKKKASLIQGILALKSGEIDAFVSAGSTGALMAASNLFLPLTPGVKRVALLAEIPTVKEPLIVVDVGGRLSVEPEDLLQYALIGAKEARLNLPRVGLLNIGVESRKGTENHIKTHQLLSQQSFHFIGNVEARDIFSGEIDVLVTDGFSGNVLIKTAEGVAWFLMKHFNLNEKKFTYENHPGAKVVGIEKRVVKTHGQATPESLFSAIQGCVREC